MIKPWLFEFIPELGDEAHDPQPRDVADYVARYLDLWAHDEALGFEGIFFSEHHFGGSFSASPNLMIVVGKRCASCMSSSNRHHYWARLWTRPDSAESFSAPSGIFGSSACVISL